ncbi:unnamed protein product, partial [marine sediment metagenome]
QTFTTDSSVGYSYTNNLNTEFLDLTDSAKTISHDILIKNDLNNIIGFIVTYDFEQTLLDEECPDWEDDCVLSVMNGVTEINSGDYVELTGLAERSVNVQISCVQYACPSENIVNVQIAPV